MIYLNAWYVQAFECQQKEALLGFRLAKISGCTPELNSLWLGQNSTILSSTV
jgi:hypothetical protein